MILPRPLFCIFGALIICVAHVATAVEEAVDNFLQVPADQITATTRETAMPDLGEGKLAKIIQRYYEEGLGGKSVWEQISSLKLVGTLKLESGEYELKAYQKKPNLIKLIIRGDQRDMVLGYDGEVAWRKLPGRNVKAEPMSEVEGRRFIHNGFFGSHLLYPFALGKTIEYIDTVPTDGNICHQIRVTLATDYQVDYYIDIRSHLAIKSVSTDLLNNVVNSVVYRDYEREAGMPLAKQVESYEEGEWRSSLRIEEVKVNSGVIPWMFRMPR
ncbi:hypothetical protein SH580_11575 [Coraliomargarita algicola]|uniref:Outer membrane lipoprotein-sorting protein n=1 Tax=Coraliomargarita algicola TaxID=3092156 RepID=A0ABZ0RG55_9BACT|nr:hypothetical protein [Coraliomargarita sp. J2-16]WPJ94073.1 hypothetical protein SH580_11575 [Coraliomargarita sp. J2-16]